MSVRLESRESYAPPQSGASWLLSEHSIVKPKLQSSFRSTVKTINTSHIVKMVRYHRHPWSLLNNAEPAALPARHPLHRHHGAMTNITSTVAVSPRPSLWMDDLLPICYSCPASMWSPHLHTSSSYHRLCSISYERQSGPRECYLLHRKHKVMTCDHQDHGVAKKGLPRSSSDRYCGTCSAIGCSLQIVAGTQIDTFGPQMLLTKT